MFQIVLVCLCVICDHCNLICCLFCCPACLPVDYKGGNGYIISPCSSVNSRSVLASNAIGDQCKSKKTLSAAKACIPQILPSKFKPKLLPPSGDSQDSRTEAVRHTKAHSCEDLYTGRCGTVCAAAGEPGSETDSDKSGCGSDCTDGLGNDSPAIRRTTSEFSSLYRTMHHIQRPSSAGCSPHGSVRSLTSLFEKVKAETESSEADGSGGVSKDSVSSRVSAFEMIIQRSSSTPSRSASLPTLHSSHSPNHKPAVLYMGAAVSAEALLVPDTTSTIGCTPEEPEESEAKKPRENTVPSENHLTEEEAGELNVQTEAEVEQICRKSCQDSETKSPSAQLIASSPHQSHLQHHHHHLLHHLNHQLPLKPSKCKGSCPASYTRFTTILRHERLQATTHQEKPPPSEKKATLPGNLLLMGPAPFRLRKNLQSHQTRRTLATKVTVSTQRPCTLSTELRPLIPQRLSSLEVLERLNNGEDTDHLNNGQNLDANGNLLQPLSAHRRGGYLHPFTAVTLSVCGHSLISTLCSRCVLLLHKVPPSISSLCAVLQWQRLHLLFWCFSFHRNEFGPSNTSEHMSDCRRFRKNFSGLDCAA